MRLAVFVLAGLLAGLSGWLYAHMQRFVNPTPFDVRTGIELLFMALVGGTGRIAGAVIGAAIVVLLKNFLQDVLPSITRYNAQMEIVLFGVLFIILLQKARGGVVAMFRRFMPRPAPPMPVEAPPLPRTRQAAAVRRARAAHRERREALRRARRRQRRELRGPAWRSAGPRSARTAPARARCSISSPAPRSPRPAGSCFSAMT